VFKGLKQ